jgi:haloalkane dehalogenase
MERRHFLRMSAAAGGVGMIDPGRAVMAAPPFTSAAGFDAARRFASLRAGRVAYVERGRGRAALFLHGFPLSGYQWRGAIERLAAERRCIAPDFLALGRTEVAAGQAVGPDAQVAMLVELLEALKVRDVDLVASDSGGAVAQLLLVRHPARVRTLLLTNCDTEPDSPPPALKPVIDLSREGTFVDRWLAPWLADPALARSATGIGGLCYTDPAHPTDDAIRTYFAPLVASPGRKALVHAYALALEPNPLAGIAPALGRSTAPTRIVWGTADTIFSAESPAYLDRTFGRSRGVRLLPGRKLFFPEEVPDVVAEEARRLWASA